MDFHLSVNVTDAIVIGSDPNKKLQIGEIILIIIP